MPTRRIVTAGLAALTLGGCDARVVKAVSGAKDLAKRMADIQTRHGGRLGVSAITSSGSGRDGFNLHADQRFAHCSTFKWVLAASILYGVDQGRLSLLQSIAYGPKDLLSYAPVTKAHVGDGHMSIGDLCAAAVELSDNTAANLLLSQIGGPAGLTAFVRGLGDTVTRFDRTEPELNSNIADDPRDPPRPPPWRTC